MPLDLLKSGGVYHRLPSFIFICAIRTAALRSGSHLGLALVLLTSFSLSAATPLRTLSGHLSQEVTKLLPTGSVPATQVFNLTIGLKLHDPEGLTAFLKDLQDPISPNYHRYLSNAEFTERFGPTKAEYAAVVAFAKSNHFTITGMHGNRMLLNVSGTAAVLENAFHLKLHTYQLAAQNRNFFSPDNEPSVEASLPIADVSGLSDYAVPVPRSHHLELPSTPIPYAGSGAGSNYLGDDFRRAYVPGTALTGAGQSVGLFQYNGFRASDIAAYAAAAGGTRSNIVIQTVLFGGYNGTPSGSGELEVDLDIEMAMAMAPGLSSIVVYEANSVSFANDIFNAMATNTAIKQFSCSWGWSGGPYATSEALFLMMQAQGQSFFNASGDSDAFTPGTANDVNNRNQAHFPVFSPNITQVGGTSLTMNGAGLTYTSETTWNSGTNANGTGLGTSGGIDASNTLPWWQQSISMATSLGSPSNHNIPDVSMVALNIDCINSGGSRGSVLGTSAAAPLWAGFMALVNQQNALLSRPSAGFINPAVYAIGKGQSAYSYGAAFNDITNGNNTWPLSLTNFPAVTGYDLCTGWGSPKLGLIPALVNSVNPTVYFTNDSGPGSLRYLLTNVPSGSTIYFAQNLSGATIRLTNGELPVNLSVTLDASALPDGIVINGNQADRLFEIAGGVTVTMNSLTLTNGRSTGSNPGGAILNGGKLFLTNCTLAGNSAGGSGTGGAIRNESVLTLVGCALSGNSAAFAGAIDNVGACTNRNCTFSGNTATAGNGGAIDNAFSASLSLLHCTFSGNSASSTGGSIDNYQSVVILTNTIVAASSPQDIYNWSASTVVAGGSNIVQSLANAGTLTGSATISTVNPQLNTLGSYGGLTRTMPPLAGSPVIDAVSNALLATDQRGYPRPIGPAADIGAAEYAAPTNITTVADAGLGSLRYAMLYSGVGTTLTFATNLSGSTITLTSGELSANHNLIIDASALPGGLTLSGNGASRALYVNAGVTHVLNRLIITNCVSTASHLSGYGGALFVDGTLILNNCTVANSTASTAGGAIYNRIGQGVVTVNYSTLSGNSAAYGGAIQNEGTLIANSSTMSSNTASTQGGAISAPFSAPVSLNQSTLSGNSSAQGGGIFIASGGTIISNTIIAGNTAGSGANISGSCTNLGGSVTNGNPLLAALGNYGGFTQTMPPLVGSPAIDVCVNGTSFPKDQRDGTRIVGPFADAGAVEFHEGSPIVTTNLDAGIGSLRYACTYSPIGSTVTFAPNLSGSTITLTNSQIQLLQNLTIDASALANGITVSGNNVSRAFYIPGGVTNTLNGLTIANCVAAPAPLATYGGAVFVEGFLNLTNCTLTNNSAATAGGALLVRFTGATATVNNCTFSQNSTTGTGGAIQAEGPMTINNSTFSGNTGTGSGGAIQVGFTPTLAINFCTFTANSSAVGAGLNFTTNAALTTLFNNIVAGNTGGGSNIAGAYIATGGNLTNGSPQLAPLGNYGGPTPTMPPLAGSPAIDAAAASAFTLDQRGFPRVIGPAPDLGAAEFFVTNAVVSTTANSGIGSLRQVITYATNGTTVTFSNGLAGGTIVLTNGQITLNKNLTIDGSTLSNGVAISGNNVSRVFEVASGVVTLNSVTITNGNVLNISGLGGGLLVDSNATLYVNNSVIVGNVAGYGGGILNNYGTLAVNNSSVFGNSAGASGGLGGGIYNFQGTLTVRNCTIMGNSATNGPGTGGGLYTTANGAVTNTIICSNNAPNFPNLLASGSFTSANNLVDANPLLAPPGNYGGPTLNRPPLPGSPAIDAGAGTTLTNDQRGFPRVSGSAPDIGAVELHSVISTLAENGAYSIRQVILGSVPGQTNTFAPALSGGTILLTNDQVILNQTMTLDGSGLPRGIAISGNNHSRVFEVASGVATLNYLTITNGNSQLSTGLGGGILVDSNATLIVNNSAIVGNLANYGGGILSSYGNLTLNNSTVFGNVAAASAGLGGGIYNFQGALTVRNCTIFGNSANNGPATGGGLYTTASTTMTNTIVCSNNAPSFPNLLATGSFSGTSNLVDASPQLAALGNFGGPTPSMPPLLGSPVVNAGAPTTLAADQRGFPRLFGSAPDIGAVERVTVVSSLADNNTNSSLRQILLGSVPGQTNTFAPGLSGGTVVLTNGQVTLTRSLILDGSGLPNGIAISGNSQDRVFEVASGSATFNFLTITNGNAQFFGGLGGGILVDSNATLVINNSAIVGNQANYGGGILSSYGNLTLNNSTVAGNSAVAFGALGGGVYNFQGTLAVRNCTIAGNSANNPSSTGGGLYTTASTTMANTIVCSNNAPSFPNLLATGGFAGTNNLVDANAQLAPLGNYGGPTPARPPLAGSPAIDAGADAVASAFTTDQRGTGYARVVGAHVDIGAIELSTISSTNPPVLTSLLRLGDGRFQFAFSNLSGASFSVLASTNVALPLNQWSNLGAALESPPTSGQFQFTDSQATNNVRRFYRVRSP